MFNKLSIKIYYAKFFLIGLLAYFPVFASAQNTIKSLLGDATNLVTKGVIGLLMGLVLVSFFGNISKLLSSAADPNQRKEIKQTLFWLIALMFVLITVWGIIEQVGAWLGITVSSTTN